MDWNAVQVNGEATLDDAGLLCQLTRCLILSCTRRAPQLAAGGAVEPEAARDIRGSVY